LTTVLVLLASAVRAAPCDAQERQTLGDGWMI
jgi:hypothetical protein